MANKLLVIVPARDGGESGMETALLRWTAELNGAGVDYIIMLLLEDVPASGGNRLLEKLSPISGRLQQKRLPKCGHGQTCLEGYRLACWSDARWVLQIDPIGRCDPACFREMWDRRGERTVVYGHRLDWCNGWSRMLKVVLLRGLVRLTTGVDCPDANAPCRLMSTAGLLPLVDTVPSGFNLANIALAVQIKRAGWRETAVPVHFRRNSRPTPVVPLMRSVGQALELCGQLLLLPRPVLRPVL